MGLTKINIVKQNYSHLGNEWSYLTKLYKMTAAVNRSIIVYIYIQHPNNYLYIDLKINI